jgi:Spy/CpxP family protein refolding chaperone
LESRQSKDLEGSLKPAGAGFCLPLFPLSSSFFISNRALIDSDPFKKGNRRGRFRDHEEVGMFARLLLASAFAAGLTFAQGGMGGGMGGGGGRNGGGDIGAESGMGGGMPRPQRQSKAEIVADKLHLNKDQKEKFTAIVSEAQEEMRPITEQIGQGRNVITTAIIQGKSGDELNKLMGQFTDLMAQRGGVEAKAYAKLYAVLDPKQQAKAGAVFAAEMDGMFDARGGRGGRQR